MDNLYKKLLLESLEDSAAKYQKDIDKVQAVAKAVSSNEDKFKRDFIKYFYQENGERDTNNADTDSQEEYMKSGSEEVARYLVQYVIKLLGGDNNEFEISKPEYSKSFIFNMDTFTNLSFTGFSVKVRVEVTPNPKNRPGKKFLFDVSLDNSEVYLIPDDTHDREFDIPEEPYKFDILAYKDYEYRENKVKDKVKAFRSKYENSPTSDVVKRTWFTLQDSKDAPKNVNELYKFTETFVKAILKHLKLKPEGSTESKKDYLNYHSTSVRTDIGTLYVNTHLIGGDYGALDSVRLYVSGADPVDLYKND